MPKLTATFVANVKPDPSKRVEIPDAVLPGLYCVVQPSGARSWAVRYRHQGRPRKLTLGAYPAICLAQAREFAIVLHLIEKLPGFPFGSQPRETLVLRILRQLGTVLAASALSRMSATSSTR